MLPSIEVHHVQQEDGTRRDSVTNASSTGDTEEGSEPYEPPDVLPDDVDDEVAQKGSDRAASYHGKLAVPTIATDASGLDKPPGYEPGNGDIRWDTCTAKRKLCEQSKLKQLVDWVDHPVDVQRSRDEDEAQMKKRQKMGSIVH
jgi:hypothetical protein